MTSSYPKLAMINHHLSLVLVLLLEAHNNTTRTGHQSQGNYMSFDDSEALFTNGYFEQNIDNHGYHGSGDTASAIASPSNENGNYLYHWQHDAAIPIQTLQYTANDFKIMHVECVNGNGFDIFIHTSQHYSINGNIAVFPSLLSFVMLPLECKRYFLI